MTDVVDGQAVEVGTDLVVREPAPTPGLFHTTDPVEVVEKAARVADALSDVINRKQLFTMIQGKAHIDVAGWTLLGSMLGVTAVVTGTEKLDELTWKATVEARDQTGRVIGAADAVCSGREKRGPWKTADDYARCSMAQTRATSKALKGPLGFIVSLAGYQATPAEEMTFAEPDVPEGAASSPAATPSPRAHGAPAEPPPRPARHQSDVTTDDPWTEGVIRDLKAVGIWEKPDLLKEGLREAGVVPASGARRATVLSRLDAPARETFRAWLDRTAEGLLIGEAQEKLGATEEKAA